MYKIPLWELACQRWRPDSRPISCRCTPNPCGSWLACDGGLTADQYLADVQNSPVGAGLPAMAEYQTTSMLDVRPQSSERRPEQARSHRESVSTGGSAMRRRFWYGDVIQHSIHRQLGQHDDLLNRHCRVPMWPFQIPRKITRHHTGLGQ
jgi:hypothetical protein